MEVNNTSAAGTKKIKVTSSKASEDKKTASAKDTKDTKKAKSEDLEKELKDKEKAAKAANEKAQELRSKYSKSGKDVKIKVDDNKITISFSNGKKQVLTVNKKGSVVEKEISTGKGDNKQVKTTKFNSLGEKISSESTKGVDDKKITIKVDYKDGKKIKKTTEGMIDDEPVCVTIKFDKTSAKKTSKIIETGEGSSAKKISYSYEYDKENRLISKKRKDSQDEDEYEYKYNDKGQLKKTTVKKADGSSVTSSYSDYDKKDSKTTRVKKVVTEDKDGNKTETKVEQTLNKNGKVVSETHYNKDGKKIKTVKITYGDDGKCSEKVVQKTLDNGTKVKTTYSGYKRDELSSKCSYTRVEVEKDGDETTTKGSLRWFANETRINDKKETKTKEAKKEKSEKADEKGKTRSKSKLKKLIDDIKDKIKKLKKSMEDLSKSSSEYKKYEKDLKELEETKEEYEDELADYE